MNTHAHNTPSLWNLRAFSVKTVRQDGSKAQFTVFAPHVVDALFAVNDLYGDTLPSRVTAAPFKPLRKDATMNRAKTANQENPDSASLEIAYRRLQTPMTFENVMKSERLKKALFRMARKHMKNRDRLDIKKMQAHDHD